jgi:hypothetical protein
MNDVRIVRCGRREDTFARVDRALLDDERLSWKAKGILAYLMGKPDGWKMRVSDLENHGPDGEHAIRSGLNELRRCGYAELIAIREKGRVKEWIWKVSDYPIYPDCGFPHLDKPHLEKGHYSKNEVRKNDSSKNERTKETKDCSSSGDNDFEHPSTPAASGKKRMLRAAPRPSRETFIEFTSEECPRMHEVSRDERLFDELEQSGWMDTKTPPRPIRSWRKYAMSREECVAGANG